MKSKIAISLEKGVVDALDLSGPGNRSGLVELAVSVYFRQLADALVSCSDKELHLHVASCLNRVEAAIATQILSERADLGAYTSPDALRRVGEVIDRAATLVGQPVLPLDGIRAATAYAMAAKIEAARAVSVV